MPAGTAPQHRSQNLTAKDSAVGQVRILTGATKTRFPAVRQDVVVNLRSRTLRCWWDPRYGDTERSGVVRLGKSVATDLLSPADALVVVVAGDGFVHLD